MQFITSGRLMVKVVTCPFFSTKICSELILTSYGLKKYYFSWYSCRQAGVTLNYD
jgi:hypothetical protein